MLIDDAEMEEEELNTAEEEEFIVVAVAADSGAGDNVASQADAPGYAVKGSASSRRGGNFVGAGGHRMKNKGETLLHMEAPGGQARRAPWMRCSRWRTFAALCSRCRGCATEGTIE